MAEKYQVIPNGEIVEAEQINKELPILTGTGVVRADKGSWCVCNAEGTVSIISNELFVKKYKPTGEISHMHVLGNVAAEPDEPAEPAKTIKPAKVKK